MKIRTITYGIRLQPSDFQTEGKVGTLIRKAAQFLQQSKEKFEELGHVLQTVRLSLNSFEEWLIPLLKMRGSDGTALYTAASVMSQIKDCLLLHHLHFCSIGCCTTLEGIELLPSLLKDSDIFSGSVAFAKDSCANAGATGFAVTPDHNLCRAAAAACLQLAKDCGDLGNFRYAVSFGCEGGIPFFPTAYHAGTDDAVSLGLECGDLLFIAFHGADSCEEGSNNLKSTLQQALLPLQRTLEGLCTAAGISYRGIDASINPGLELPYSVGAGLEYLLSEPYHQFGAMGTLAAVSTVTSAVKAIGAEEGDHAVKLTGYSGLMLPVMEDVILAQRACEKRYSLRDLLTFSSVCGVGLDTVPIPGNTTIDQLAGVYTEVGALAFRLSKPLSCRLLPMAGKAAGELTDVNSPYLCNTAVFSIP